MADLSSRRVESRSASLATIEALISDERRACKLMSVGGLEVLQFVPHLGGAFVIFAQDGIVQGAFEALASGERALGPYFIEPIFERLDFRALVSNIRAGMLAIKTANLFETVFDMLDGHGMILRAQRLRTTSAGQDHQQLRLELAKRPRQLFRLGMFAHEIKDRQIAFCVPDDGRIIFQLQQANVAMVELDGFHLQLRTILGFELKALITAFMGRDVFVETGLVVLEERRMAEGPLAVRTTLSIHLQQTEIHPKLELFLAIFGFESADDHLSGLIIPLVQEVRYVEVHDANMDGGGQQVNGQERSYWDTGEPIQPIQPLRASGLSHAFLSPRYPSRLSEPCSYR